MGVTFKQTSTGEMAIMPRAEYERLVEQAEDAGTARLVNRARREVAGRVPLLPKQVADRLANGENPIRVLREFRGYTQVELAQAVVITQGYLSDLESGKRKGPFELHQKIAAALGVPFELLARIGVTLEEADPAHFANRKRAIKKMQQERRRR